MNETQPTETKMNRSRGLSIQQRLPLLICILLLCIIVTFSWTSYLGVKKAALKVGHDRLQSVSEQLSSMFAQSSKIYLTTIRGAAGQDSIKRFLLSGGKDFRTESLGVMEKLRSDTASLLVELLDASKAQVLQSGKPGIDIKLNRDSILTDLAIAPDSVKVGNLYLAGDSIYYPVVASVTDKNKIIGYIVRWRLVHASPKAIEQFSKFIGTNATLNMGNNDGSLWTDLVKPISSPPVDTAHLKNFFEYSLPQSNTVIATVRLVPNTPWLVLVGFSQAAILEPANHFLNSTVVLGGILIIIGIIIAWFMSRNITRPLNKLTVAASAIAAGDYSLPVEVHRNDELGKLARAFNVMATQVHTARLDLEKKVQERTAQLETVNKELEAFSYSVSHDLRAPLRAISCYATILNEEYGTKLDDEATRITGRIISNAKMMGQLIDDLISFSQLGVKEAMHQTVDMKTLAEACLSELLQHEPPNKYHVRIHSLPPCYGDANLIRQVWMNLIGNSIKYSSKEPTPIIEIDCTEEAHFNTYCIKDNGVGFDMQYAHKLFGVFQRLHSRKVFEGTGIGLALVKRIISKHNGKVRAESSLGAGATFYFSLPASKKSFITQVKGFIKSNNHE